jgi:hypothetical protein
VYAVTKLTRRGEEIRQFILENIEEHPRDVATLTSQTFGITRQAVNKHIQRLVEQKAIVVKGSTKNKTYELCPLVQWEKDYLLKNTLQEDVVWDSDIKPFLIEFPGNVRSIWFYGFSEMMNNAIEHSSGKRVSIRVIKTASYTEIVIADNGEGIFNKIQRALNLQDPRHAVLELAKGKFTTDPSRHSGQGIFFTSRMFDEFVILSGNIIFAHRFDRAEDWISQTSYSPDLMTGTMLSLKLKNNTARTIKQVFDQFSSDDDYAFSKTVVPVHLAQYGDEQLVSRSQAKRLTAGLDKFKTVIFDFSNVTAIGQAFADEVFRVFRNQHPELEIRFIDANEEVTKMIRRAECSVTA